MIYSSSSSIVFCKYTENEWQLKLGRNIIKPLMIKAIALVKMFRINKESFCRRAESIKHEQHLGS